MPYRISNWLLLVVTFGNVYQTVAETTLTVGLESFGNDIGSEKDTSKLEPSLDRDCAPAAGSEFMRSNFSGIVLLYIYKVMKSCILVHHDIATVSSLIEFEDNSFGVIRHNRALLLS